MRKLKPERWFLIVSMGWALAALYSEIRGNSSTFDIQLHDTYFVIAGVHVYLMLTVLFGFYALFYRYNRRMSRVLGMIHFWMSLLGTLVLFWPYQGLAGMPRRYMDYSNWVSFDQYGGYGRYFRVVMWLAVLGVLGQLVFFVNVVYSMVGGRKSAD